RQYAEPVEVERRDDQPGWFSWRGRGYAVRGVLDHWMRTGAWWDAAGGTDAGAAGDAVGGAPALVDAEREFWRVEAVADHARHTAVVAVVDLGFDWTSGRWTLRRVFD